MAWCSRKRMSAHREESKREKKERGRKFSFAGARKNTPGRSLSPIKAIQTSSLCGKGARFQNGAQPPRKRTLRGVGEFSTVWFLGRSRGDKDKGTGETDRRADVKRARAALFAITFASPIARYNVQTLICIRVASRFVCSSADEESQMGMR